MPGSVYVAIDESTNWFLTGTDCEVFNIPPDCQYVVDWLEQELCFTFGCDAASFLASGFVWGRCEPGGLIYWDPSNEQGQTQAMCQLRLSELPNGNWGARFDYYPVVRLRGNQGYQNAWQITNDLEEIDLGVPFTQMPPQIIEHTGIWQAPGVVEPLVRDCFVHIPLRWFLTYSDEPCPS